MSAAASANLRRGPAHVRRVVRRAAGLRRRSSRRRTAMDGTRVWRTASPPSITRRARSAPPLEVLDRSPPARVGADSDGILWRACRVNVLSMLGDDDQAIGPGRSRPSTLAEASGDPRSLVAAHQAKAKTSSGSRKEAHLGMALEAARRAWRRGLGRADPRQPVVRAALVGALYRGRPGRPRRRARH